jgi:hypothetical protein
MVNDRNLADGSYLIGEIEINQCGANFEDRKRPSPLKKEGR